jgi:hypothetical protein
MQQGWHDVMSVAGAVAQQGWHCMQVLGASWPQACCGITDPRCASRHVDE